METVYNFINGKQVPSRERLLIGLQPLRYVVPGLCLNLKNC